MRAPLPAPAPISSSTAWARPPTSRRSAPRIESDFKVKAVHSPADMTKPAEIAGMIALGEKTFGSVDVLVNNAGIQFVSPIEEFPIEKWDAIIAINLSSAFHGIRAAVPGMKKRGWGRIINTASAHSLVASPFKSAYVSAKHGIAGLTKTVALELATFKITCNCISPGYVWTPLVEHQIPDTMKARNMTKEQVIHDVLLDSAADQGVRHLRAGRGAGAVPVRRRRRADHRRQPLDRRRLDRGVGHISVVPCRRVSPPASPTAGASGASRQEIEMDDDAVRLALERHWDASDANDFTVEHEIYREDAVLDYPQSGERIRGRRNIQESRFVQPNKKRFTVRRIIGSGDLWVTEFVLTYDGIPSYTVSIMEFREGLVAHETQYFADRFDPAPSRAHLVEQVGKSSV